jgi:hypothetical protein
MVERHGTSPAPETDREQLRRCFDSVFDDINGLLDERDEQKREERQEQLGPLCVMKRIEWNIQLAWGGPAYGFKLYYDPESRDWIRGDFYWAHWFKYEEQELSQAEMDKVIEAYSMESMVD